MKSFISRMNITLGLTLCMFSTFTLAKDVTFAVIGDFGTDDSREAGVAQEVAKWNADFVVTVGDNRYSSRSMDAVIGKYYCEFLTDVTPGNRCAGGNSPINAFFPSPGNHDYDDGGGVREYLRYFTLPGAGVATLGTSGSERYYDFIQGPVHFFAIDSEGSSISGQRAWLQNALQASNSKWKVVFFHHPPYSSSRHGSNSSMQWEFADWGADVVLAGHDHIYERIERDGILYFVNGMGGRTFYGINSAVTGSKIRYNKNNGAMRVRASDTAMTFEFVTRAGVVIDKKTISKGTPTPSPTAVPTAKPTAAPTARPTPVPTAVPTARPTPVPTAVPTARPTPVPTAVPTARPTPVPTAVPTARPTPVPTAVPTARPTPVPTAKPTAKPTAAPTATPTPVPTAMPTGAPTTPVNQSFSVVRLYDNKNGKNFRSVSGDELRDINSRSKNDEKVEVLGEDNSYWWESYYVNPTTDVGKPSSVRITMEYRPEEDWTGAFTAEYRVGDNVLASIPLPGNKRGRKQMFAWDLSSKVTTVEQLQNGRVRFINRDQKNGKKVYIDYSSMDVTMSGTAK